MDETTKPLNIMALEIEAFEPGLKGLLIQIQGVQVGQQISINWLNTAAPFISNSEAIAELAMALSSHGDFQLTKSPKVASEMFAGASTLHEKALGKSHPNTQMLAQKVVQPVIGKRTLPRIRRFDK